MKKKWKMSEHEFCPDCDVVVNFCDMHQKKWYIINGNIEECPDCAANRDNEDHNHTGNDNIGDLPINEHLIDGVDVNNSKHFTFNTSQNSGFDSTLKEILKSVSTFRTLLGYFDKGCVHLTFAIGPIKVDGKEVSSPSATTYPSEESFLITFNKDFVTETGLNINAITDNIGFDWSQVNSQEEALVVVLVHETLHAKHRAIYNEAVAQCDKNPNKLAQYLLDRGYSQEFVEIYCYKANNDQWYHYEWDVIGKRAHAYMEKYDHDVIEDALREYQRDHNLR